MDTFLVIQSTYTAIECALFKDRVCVAPVRTIDKMVASRILVSVIDNLLTSHNLTIRDLDYCVVNLGPAPFTTLRVVVATMNGLQYAVGLPLIGINCFEAWMRGLDRHEYSAAVIMNAFSNELYMALRLPFSSQFSYACLPIDDVVERLSAIPAEKIVLAGNGFSMHREFFERQLGDKIMYPVVGRSMNVLNDLALVGWERWQVDRGTQEPLIPLYVKGSLAR